MDMEIFLTVVVGISGFIFGVWAATRTVLRAANNEVQTQVAEKVAQWNSQRAGKD